MGNLSNRAIEMSVFHAYAKSCRLVQSQITARAIAEQAHRQALGINIPWEGQLLYLPMIDGYRIIRLALKILREF